MTARPLAALAAALLLGTPLAAQQRLQVRAEPGSPVVTAQLLLAVGPADEPEGEAGIAYLTARSAVAPIRPLLDSLGARLIVDAHRDAVSFSLTAAPDVWDEVTRLLMVAVFRDPVDSASVARQRTALTRELHAREVSPADALARSLDQAVFGAEHPWARPAVGVSDQVRGIRWTAVDEFLRSRFTPDRAVIAVIGPVEPDEVRDHLGSFLGDAPLTPGEVPPAAPADSVVHVDYNSITAWVGVSYPFGAETDADAVRMLADLAMERLSFGPSRRSVYDVHGEVVRNAGGRGELRITLVVPPREAAIWAERIREAVAVDAEGAMPAARFAERLRRYRGRRLLSLDSPEARVDALARAVLVDGHDEPLGAGRQLTPQALLDAARALGSPLVVLLGPFEGGDDN